MLDDFSNIKLPIRVPTFTKPTESGPWKSSSEQMRHQRQPQQRQHHIKQHPPSLWPPVGLMVLTAIWHISSNASWRSSPVTAEHSMYLSALISEEIRYASCG